MPKLFSQSKHKEFESNSALQIRNQKERGANNKEIGASQEFCRDTKFRSILPVTIHLMYYSSFLLFDALTILFPFGFLSFLPRL